MKSIVFDSGPLISLTMNNLLWIIEPLKSAFGGDFFIPESVKLELVDEPLQTKKFKFEALQIQELLSRKILKVLEDRLTKGETLSLLRTANSCFSAKGKSITIVHYAEISSIVSAVKLNSSALVMDERITRELVEHPEHLARLMEKKLHMGIMMNRAMIDEFKGKTSGVSIIRSTELASVAFEKGLLEKYAAKPEQRKTVLESVLWGLKLDGCAIDERGIKAIMNIELKK